MIAFKNDKQLLSLTLNFNEFPKKKNLMLLN